MLPPCGPAWRVKKFQQGKQPVPGQDQIACPAKSRLTLLGGTPLEPSLEAVTQWMHPIAPGPALPGSILAEATHLGAKAELEARSRLDLTLPLVLLDQLGQAAHGVDQEGCQAPRGMSPYLQGRTASLLMECRQKACQGPATLPSPETDAGPPQGHSHRKMHIRGSRVL